MKFTIYCHIHTESGRRYIGQTSQTVERRWKNHVYASKFSRDGKWHFPNAIRKYGKEAFSHEILEICDSIELSNAAEIKWIEHFQTRDPEKGFNLARGGSYTPHPVTSAWNRPEYREKHLPRFVAAGQSTEARANCKASLNTPESKAKRSASTKILMNSPETIARRRVFQDSPEYKLKISETTKAGLSDPVIRQKVSDGVKRMWTQPEIRGKITSSMKDAFSKPEMKGKISEYSKKTWQDDDIRFKRLEAMKADASRPEKRELHRQISTGKRHTPESIEKQRKLYLERSSHCKFCGCSLGNGKRTCIKGKVSCNTCFLLHKQETSPILST